MLEKNIVYHTHKVLKVAFQGVRYWCGPRGPFLHPSFHIWMLIPNIAQPYSLACDLRARVNFIHAILHESRGRISPAGFINRCSLPLHCTQLSAPEMFTQTSMVMDSQRFLLTSENTKEPKQPSHGVTLKQ